VPLTALPSGLSGFLLFASHARLPLSRANTPLPPPFFHIADASPFFSDHPRTSSRPVQWEDFSLLVMVVLLPLPPFFSRMSPPPKDARFVPFPSFEKEAAFSDWAFSMLMAKLDVPLFLLSLVKGELLLLPFISFLPGWEKKRPSSFIGRLLLFFPVLTHFPPPQKGCGTPSSLHDFPRPPVDPRRSSPPPLGTAN